MATKHTSGPWKSVSPKVTGTKKWMILGEYQNNGKIATIETAWGNNSEEANARLIASAPELLDLAKEALNQLEKMDFSCSANWNWSIKTNVALLLEAAIAKAEGKI